MKLTWTTDAPTKPGWYWIQVYIPPEYEEHIPVMPGLIENEIVFVYKTGQGELAFSNPWSRNKEFFVNEYDAKWAGPIPEPEDS